MCMLEAMWQPLLCGTKAWHAQHTSRYVTCRVERVWMRETDHLGIDTIVSVHVVGLGAVHTRSHRIA